MASFRGGQRKLARTKKFCKRNVNWILFMSVEKKEVMNWESGEEKKKEKTVEKDK